MRYFIYCFIIVAMASCKPSQPQAPATKNLQSYYYPVESLRKGLVYAYESMDTLRPPYYEYFIVVDDSASNRYLVSNYYNAAFQQSNLRRERILPDGMWLEEMRFFYPNSSGKLESIIPTIKDRVVFPFVATPSDSLSYRMSLEYTLPDANESHNTVLRDRFIKGFEDYTYKNKVYQCVRTEVKSYEEFTARKGGGYGKEESITEELYAEGLGLVYTKRTVKGQIVAEYRLRETMTMEDFEKLAASSFQ